MKKDIKELERQLVVERNKNALLMEQLKDLKDGIIEVYNSMMSLDRIYELEVDILEHEDIEEI